MDEKLETMRANNATEDIGADRIVFAPFSERLPEFVIIGVISLLALFGNTSLWLIVLRDRQLRTFSNWIVLCLSGADLFVSAVNMPFIMFNLWKGQWVLAHSACVTLGFVSMTTFISSVLSLASISWNRYMFICHPSRYKSVYTKAKTLALIAGIWITASILAMPPLLGWGRYNYIPTQSICFCEWKTSTSYTFFMVGVCFGGPCTVMAFCYVRILREVSASKRRLQNNKSHAAAKNCALAPDDRSVTDDSKSYIEEELKSDAAGTKTTLTTFIGSSCSVRSSLDGSTIELPPPSVESPPPSTGDYKDKNTLYPPQRKLRKTTRKKETGSDLKLNVAEIGADDGRSSRISILPVVVRQVRMDRKRMEEIKLTTTFLAVVLTFIILWMPFCVTMFISVFSDKPVPRIPNMATIILGCFNSCCNPIVYGVMNKKFRNGYARLYCSLCKRCNKKRKINPFVVDDAGTTI